MPEPNRQPCLLADGLGGWAIVQVAERGVSIVIACDACPHWVEWKPRYLIERFPHARRRTIADLALRLRCSHCRSDWIRVSAMPADRLHGWSGWGWA